MKISPVLRTILMAHAVVSFAAGIALIFAPDFIPRTVGISLPGTAFLICYLLAGAEIMIAFLSFAATKIREQAPLQLILWSFVILHGVTAIVEFIAFAQGVSASVLINAAIRLVIAAIFASYAFRK